MTQRLNADSEYNHNLLEQMVIISTQPPDFGEAPVVTMRQYPVNAAAVPKNLPEFCFPDLPRVLRGEAIK
jgi:hypothetical protein